LAQILCQKTPIYFVYFKFFVSKSWGKRAASNRRRFNQRLPNSRAFRTARPVRRFRAAAAEMSLHQYTIKIHPCGHKKNKKSRKIFRWWKLPPAAA